MKKKIVNKTTAYGLLKWTKRFVVFAITIFVTQMFILQTDVRSKINIFVAHARSPVNGDVTSSKKDIINIQRICERKTNNSDSTRKPGRVFVNITGVGMETLQTLFTDTVSPGGRYFPPNCTSKQKVAIVIPYRDRDRHLRLFLRHMHPFLQRQELEYGIFVIELVRTVKFNRAMLMNIGFVEALKLDKFDCFVFHDVDLLPEDNRIPYSCAHMPRHLSVAVDKFKYKLPYDTIFGGVCALSTEHFKKINGMSNMFFGWGGEDDDFRERVYQKKLYVVRPSVKIARYMMVKHVSDHDRNPVRKCLLDSTKTRMRQDGLSNLKYKVKQLKLLPLYTWILVSINQTEQLKSDSESYRFYKKCVNSTEAIKTAIDKKVKQSLNKTL